MRYLLLVSLLFSLSVHAQTLEELTFLRLSEQQTSVRGTAMGGVSYDDPAINPAALGDVQHPLFSLSASQLEPVNGNGVTHALLAVPYGRFVLAAHYRANPAIHGSVALAPEGTAPHGPAPCCLLFRYSGDMFERRDRRAGVSAAWTSGTISAGAGAELYERNDDAALGISDFPPNSFPPELMVMRVSGRKVVPNVGIRWKATPRVALAAGYNGGAKLSREIESCQLSGDYPPRCATEYATVLASNFRSPSALRASIAVQPLENLTVIGEAVRRGYGRQESLYSAGLRHDVTEKHVGTEYRIGSVAVRGGWWNDPSVPSVDHLTFGAGVEVGPARLELAVDRADRPALRKAAVGVTFVSR